MRYLALLLIAMVVAGCVNLGGQIVVNAVEQRGATSQPCLPDRQASGNNQADIRVEIHDGGTSVGLVNPPAPEPAATKDPSASGSP